MLMHKNRQLESDVGDRYADVDIGRGVTRSMANQLQLSSVGMIAAHILPNLIRVVFIDF